MRFFSNLKEKMVKKLFLSELGYNIIKSIENNPEDWIKNGGRLISNKKNKISLYILSGPSTLHIMDGNLRADVFRTFEKHLIWQAIIKINKRKEKQDKNKLKKELSDRFKEKIDA